MNDAAPGPGHNAPPTDAEALRASLAEDHADILRRRDELAAAAARAPTSVTDEETAGKVADFAKQLAACTKDAEGRRIKAKEAA